MKKKLLLVLLFINLLSLAKGNENPNLNLEVGKTYWIETIHFVDTTKNNPIRVYDKRWYSLYVADFNNEQKFFKIKLSIPYAHYAVQQRTNFGNWKETDFFVTGFEQSKGYPPLSSTFALSNHTLIFQLRPSGVVSKVKFADYTFFNASTGTEQTYDESSLQKFENEIRNLFSLPASNSSYATSWESKIERMLQFESNDTLINDKIRIDKNTGLIAERKYTYTDTTHRYDFYRSNNAPGNFGMHYQKWLRIHEEPSTYWVSNLYSKPIQKTFTNTNTILCGKIDEYKDDVLSLTNTESFEKIKTSINDTGYFQFNLNIDSYSEWIFSMNEIFKGVGFIRLNPGDSLFLNISKRRYRLKSTTYSGIGADEMNAFSSAAKREYIVAPTKRNQPVKLIQKPNSKSPDTELCAFREIAHPDSYLALYFRKHYNNDRIEQYLKTPDSKAQFILNNSLAIQNWQYMHFLQQYLEIFLWEEIGKETYYENGKMATPFRYLYHLCEIILNEPIRYQYQYKLLERALVETSWDKSNQLAQNFFEQYPNNKRTNDLKAFYEKLLEVSPGKAAPGIELKSLNDEKIRLNHRDGIVKILNFYDLRNNKSITHLREIEDNIGHINRIYTGVKAFSIICTNDKLHLEENIKNDESRNSILVIESEDIPDILRSHYYIYDSNEIYYIIGKDGLIYSIEHDFVPGNNANLNSAISAPFQKISDETQIKYLWGIIIVTLSISLLLVAYFYFTRYLHKQQMKEAELRRKIKELENRAIRSQMNPHFIFNALNSIQGLVNQNNIDSANLYLAKFASLLRGVLNNSEHFEVTLSEEIEVVRLYCEMEQLRIDFKLNINLHSTLETEFIRVPALLLQPLVENAIIHGLAPKHGAKELCIEIRQDQQNLIFDVIDNGVGISDSRKDKLSKKGFGMKLVRDKLEILQNDGKFAELKVHKTKIGTCATIKIEI